MKRPPVKWVVLAGAALLVSWGVAWGCALWAPRKKTRSLQQARATAVLVEVLGDVTFEHEPAGTRDSGPGWALTTATIVDRRAMPEPGTTPAVSARGGGVLFQQVPASDTDRTVTVFQAGWPVTCFSGETRTIGVTRESSWLAAPSKLLDALGAKPMRKIPLRPGVAGLALNTLFYGGLFWLAGPGQLAWRRARRLRLGLCPRCGYDVAHTEGGNCPECGLG